MRRLGVDVGGTFTDLILVDDVAGEIRVDKLPTTTDDPSRGTIEGAARLVETAGLAPDDVDQFFHGTTIATNVVLERGTPCGTRSRRPGPSGGGYGEPRKRDPDAVARDVRDELLSVAAAHRDYGVVIDADTLAVDTAATELERSAER